MKIAFLGAGKMAGAIAHGLVAGKITAPADIACLGGSGTSAQKLSGELGCRLASGIDDLLAGADVLVLACKPQQFKSLDPRLGELAAGKLVLSVLAGFTTERLAGFFKNARGVVAAMPNTPAQIQAGVTAWSAPETLSPADAAMVEKIFGCLGKVVRAAPAAMNKISAVSGSGPGFFFEIAAAFEAAAIAGGLTPEAAKMLVRETFIGSAKLLEKTGKSPEELRDAVTSPGGSTLAGLKVFEKNLLRATCSEVIAAAAARAEELGKM